MTSSNRQRTPLRRCIRICKFYFRDPPRGQLLTDRTSEKKDLAQLSALGHFLKGSSATLGLTKVKDSCEKIQHYGARKDETGTHVELDEEKCLKNCKVTIEQAEKEFKEAEQLLRKFYHDTEPSS